MSRPRHNSPDHGTVDAVLQGGPSAVGGARRVPGSAVTDRKIKLPYNGGYEHFDLDDTAAALGDRGPIVFRWTMRTRIAE